MSNPTNTAALAINTLTATIVATKARQLSVDLMMLKHQTLGNLEVELRQAVEALVLS